MGNVVELNIFRNERQFIEHYLENYELEWNMIQNMNTLNKPSQKEVEREMQLAYMKLLTRKIERKE